MRKSDELGYDFSNIPYSEHGKGAVWSQASQAYNGQSGSYSTVDCNDSGEIEEGFGHGVSEEYCDAAQPASNPTTLFVGKGKCRQRMKTRSVPTSSCRYSQMLYSHIQCGLCCMQFRSYQDLSSVPAPKDFCQQGPETDACYSQPLWLRCQFRYYICIGRSSGLTAFLMVKL